MTQVTSINPNAAEFGGGAQIFVSGSGFTRATRVFFQDGDSRQYPAQFTVNSDTQMTLTCPALDRDRWTHLIVLADGEKPANGGRDSEFHFTEPSTAEDEAPPDTSICPDSENEALNWAFAETWPSRQRVTQTSRHKIYGKTRFNGWGQLVAGADGLVRVVPGVPGADSQLWRAVRATDPSDTVGHIPCGKLQFGISISLVPNQNNKLTGSMSGTVRATTKDVPHFWYICRGDHMDSDTYNLYHKYGVASRAGLQINATNEVVWGKTAGVIDLEIKFGDQE
ncbi:IPT/TIG domain-containing protein [Nocardia sp. NPDC056100]|uniref:IPT/TIG domain-containing protein n=1 Tax=Nocardia sp. NPDC056100 TaxID=3345712 RepID=UPI0035E33421